MKKTPRNSINDGWRTTASLRRAAFVLLAIFALFTFFNVAPNSAIAADTAPNGTRGKQIVDGMGAVWTFSGEKTLRNGVWVGEGNALEYLYTNNSVYAIASDNSVWRWTGTNWTFAGSDISHTGAGLGPEAPPPITSGSSSPPARSPAVPIS